MNSEAQPIRVLLVDDHPAVREGLALLLSLEGIDVSAEADSRAEALGPVADTKPEAAVIDLSLEGENGVDLIGDLRARNVPVLVYSVHSEAPRLQAAFTAGALGNVTKRELRGVLVQAIREVAAGRRFVSPVAAAAIAATLAARPADDRVQKLSANERRVYERIRHGEYTLEIADALHISNRTVESYYERTLVKLTLSGMHALRRHAIDYVHGGSSTPG